jgi:17beta-estradiol 17-dehydrogenase / very-long-chain 3-oxoacyl-CoA reductase
MSFIIETIHQGIDYAQKCNCTTIAVAAVGLVGLFVVAKWALCILSGVLSALTTGSKLKKYHRPGSWAVVTGATDGIGQAFAADLYKKGWNVLIVSRTQTKLDEVIKTDLSGKGSAESVCIDFSKATDHDYARLRQALVGKDVGLLINNVGVGYPHPEYFHLIDDALIRDLVRVNIEATMFVTRAVLPSMLEQKRGLVMSISSGSSLTPTCPLLSVYAASKAYLNNWTPSMNSEYNSNGIFFETLTPFYIVSKLSKFRRPTLTIPTPEKYVKSVFSQVGNFTLHTGFWAHTAMIFILDNVFPRFYAFKYMMDLHLKARAAALRKKKDN